MPPWLSPLCLVLGKNIQFGSLVFLKVQEINLRGSKCDEYCTFLSELFSFYEKVSSPLDPVAFLKYFYLKTP